MSSFPYKLSVLWSRQWLEISAYVLPALLVPEFLCLGALAAHLGAQKSLFDATFTLTGSFFLQTARNIATCQCHPALSSLTVLCCARHGRNACATARRSQPLQTPASFLLPCQGLCKSSVTDFQIGSQHCPASPLPCWVNSLSLSPRGRLHACPFLPKLR